MALEVVQYALAASSNDAEAIELSAQALVAVGRPREAKPMLEKLLVSEPRPSTYLIYADAVGAVSTAKERAKVLSNAHQRFPRHRLIALRLVGAYMASGSLRAAQHMVEDLLESESVPEYRLSLHRLLAEIFDRLGDSVRAERERQLGAPSP